MLRIILAGCMLLYCLQSAAQIKQTKYDIKLKDLHDRTSGSKQVITHSDADSFMVAIDRTGLPANVKDTLRIIKGTDTSTVPGGFNTRNFSVANGTPFSLHFDFCEEKQEDEAVKKNFVTIRYAYDSTYKNARGRDTSERKEGTIEVPAEKQGDTIPKLNKSGKSITNISQPFEKTVTQAKDVCENKKSITVVFQKQAVEKTSAEKTYEAMTERLASILSEDSEQEAIGEMIMLDSDVSVWKTGTKEPIRKQKIKRVEVTFVHGSIGRRLLRVELEDGSVFFNKLAPINLPKFHNRKSDRLTCYDVRKDSEYIELGDVLDYHYFKHIYYPSDASLVLTKDQRRDTLRVGSTLNSLLDVSVYTDLLGLIGNKPNGLIQTEVAGNFISNTGTLPNADIGFHHFVRPYIRLSRFDSKYRSLDSANIAAGPDGKDTVQRTDLNQISYFQGGVLMNAVKLGIGVNQLIHLNVGVDINLVNTDSLYKKDIIFFNYYTELHYAITRLRNFGMDCSLRLMWQRISDNSEIANKNTIPVLRPQATIYYYPSKNQANRIYVRFNYFDNLKDSRDNFAQFQFGFKTNLKLSK